MTEPASPPPTPPIPTRTVTAHGRNPSYQLELVGDDPEERLNNLKSRLAAISSKHVVKRVSAPPDLSRQSSAASVIAEIATLEEQKRRGLILPSPPKQPAGQKVVITHQESLPQKEAQKVPGNNRSWWTARFNKKTAQDKTKIMDTPDETASNTDGTPTPIVESNEPRPLETCICNNVVNPPDPQYCLTCRGLLLPIAQIKRDRDGVVEQLEQSRQRLALAKEQQDESTHEMARLRERVHELEDTLGKKNQECDALRRDMDIMNQKLIDEIELRGELQAGKDALQDELEELTKTLFEEANTMVAEEARRRHQHEKKEKSLETLLAETQAQLQMEQMQLQELRVKMAELQMDNDQMAASLGIPVEEDGGGGGGFGEEGGDVGDEEDVPGTPVTQASGVSAGTSVTGPSSATATTTTDDSIDPLAFAEFDDFVSQAANVKPNKLNSLQFLKNVLEDDVTPCLRFGGNPRTSTKKLVEAIMANRCFVEEMTAVQIQQWQARMEQKPGPERPLSPRPATSNRTSGETPQHADLAIAAFGADRPSAPSSGTTTPTQTIFNKTVMERLSSFGSTFSAAASLHINSSAGGAFTQPPPASQNIPQGCSTCGRRTIPRFQFKISDLAEDSWAPICTNCRDRLVAVCEFYNFVRHVRQGLYSSRRREDLYKEMVMVKRKMFLARAGVGGRIGGGSGSGSFGGGGGGGRGHGRGMSWGALRLGDGVGSGRVTPLGSPLMEGGMRAGSVPLPSPEREVPPGASPISDAPQRKSAEILYPQEGLPAVPEVGPVVSVTTPGGGAVPVKRGSI
ncbi:hypothetical protein HDV00_010161 [Rhizophlyctis rosea]|nr:hypothetical protein HDV00_010161 [Rhizophlyctis rosea]